MRMGTTKSADTRTVGYNPEIAEGFGTTSGAAGRWAHIRFSRQSRLHPDLSATELLQAALPDGAFARGGDLDDYEDGVWALEPDGLEGVMVQVVRGADGERGIRFYCNDISALRRTMGYVDSRGDITRTRFYVSVTRKNKEMLDASAFPEGRVREFGERLEAVAAPGAVLDLQRVHMDTVTDPRRVSECTIMRINAEGRTSLTRSRVDAVRGDTVTITECSVHFLMKGSARLISHSEIRSMCPGSVWPGLTVAHMVGTTVYDANGLIGVAEHCEFHKAGTWSKRTVNDPEPPGWSLDSHGSSWIPGSEDGEEPDKIQSLFIYRHNDCRYNDAPASDGREFHIKAD